MVKGLCSVLWGKTDDSLLSPQRNECILVLKLHSNFNRVSMTDVSFHSKLLSLYEI